MEERIGKIQQIFKKDYEEFLATIHVDGQIHVEEKEVKKDKEEKEKQVKIPKNAHPLMMNKINKHKRDLEKNNMKKQQKAFTFHGTIDDYEKELGLSPY